jgi:hypothetical protein
VNLQQKLNLQLQKDRLRQEIIEAELAKIDRAMALRPASINCISDMQSYSYADEFMTHRGFLGVAYDLKEKDERHRGLELKPWNPVTGIGYRLGQGSTDGKADQESEMQESCSLPSGRSLLPCSAPPGRQMEFTRRGPAIAGGNGDVRDGRRIRDSPPHSTYTFRCHLTSAIAVIKIQETLCVSMPRNLLLTACRAVIFDLVVLSRISPADHQEFSYAFHSVFPLMGVQETRCW